MINFISGLMTGGLFGILLMCLLQIYRDNEAQRRIDKAIEYIYGNTNYNKEMNCRFFICMEEVKHENNLLEILGGDVDDE
jgi:hypothetical protein